MNSRLRLSLLALAAFGSASLAPAQNQVTSSAWTPAINTPNFLWYPTQKAIRFGQIDSSGSTLWNVANVGAYSFAGGLNAFADGGSFAFGENAYAAGRGFAFGDSAYAGYGWYSTGIAIGYDAYAAGGSYQAGIAIGGMSSAGIGGLALGDASDALDYSVSVGTGSSAAGAGSTAVGPYPQAVGTRSVAAGYMALASSHGGVALGTGNKTKRKDGTTPTPTATQPSDPVLMVGNAAQGWNGSDTTRSNALTVYRDGDAHLAGKLRVQPGGDIPMTGFTTVPAGVSYP